MKIETTNFRKIGVVRKHIAYNESEYKKVYLTPSEAEKFFDLGKNVRVEDFYYKNKVFVRYFVYVHIDNIIGNCL